MGEALEKINKKYLEPKGNTSLAIAAVFGVSSVATACPICVIGTMVFVVDGVRKKLER